MSARNALGVVAAGLALGAATDALLALGGAAQLSGLPVGVLCAPLLVLLGLGARSELSTGRGLLLLGAAWTAAPLVDQHLLGVVTVDDLAFDVLHHVAGWIPLWFGSQLLLTGPTTPLASR